jgi:hypothetical protein
VPHDDRSRLDDLGVALTYAFSDILIELIRNTSADVIRLKTANRLGHGKLLTIGLI